MSNTKNVAVLTDMLSLWAEGAPQRAALAAAIADVERLDKVERLKIDVFEVVDGFCAVVTGADEVIASTAREAIDLVKQ